MAEVVGQRLIESGFEQTLTSVLDLPHRASGPGRLEIGPPQRFRNRTVVALLWEPAGPDGLLPVMDGLIELHHAPQGCTSVILWARYDLPLGRSEDLVDRLVAHRVAESAADEILSLISAPAVAPLR